MSTLEVKEGQWLWMPHKEEVFIPVKPISTQGETVEVEDRDGNKYTVKVSDNLQYCQDTSRDGMNDLINLHELSDGAILTTLRDRYKKDKIYTFIASVIVAVNPYQNLPLYTDEIKVGYHNKEITDPHPYMLADKAYDDMVNNKLHQSIIISGESGSGKTETTKIILRYLSYLSGKNSDIEKQIVDANPIVEAFGNAQTIRNHNSSRFGKWIEIDFDNQYAIMGGRVKQFLLEVSRVFKQDEGERNFHFFYQMCAGLQSDDEQKLYKLQSADKFSYLRGGNTTTIDGIDDAIEFKNTMDAMRTLKFPEDDIADILKICAAILHLGNIEFEPIDNEEKSKITDATLEELNCVGELLAVSAEIIQPCFSQRVQKFSKFEEAVTIFFKTPQAESARDALSKLLYSKVFDYIINTCNASMKEGEDEWLRSGMIGILDIFGFEVFPCNRFEQFTINYANEKLQQHFNYHIFTLEKDAYHDEDVKIEAVNNNDNQGCIDMIEKMPKGLLPMLDEELKLPQRSDANYVMRIRKEHKKNAYFSTSKIKAGNQFKILHYAGAVTYDSTGFLEKNTNEVPKDLMNIVKQSKTCTRSIVMRKVKIKKSSNIKGKSTKKNTSIATLFKKELTKLMTNLNLMVPHFIRCIKPNTIQGPNKFDAPLINEQLEYNGVKHVVAIRQKGYPFRILHPRFYHRYKMLSLLSNEQEIMKGINGAAHRVTCEAFCARLECIDGGYLVGKSKILLRAHTQEKLEEERKKKITWAVAKLQGRFTSAKTINRVRQIQGAIKELVACMSLRDVDRLTEAIAECKSLNICNFQLKDAEDLCEQLEIEKKLKTRLLEMGTCLVDDWSDEKANQLIAECEEKKFNHQLVNSLKLRVVHEKIREKLREAIQSQKEDELTIAIDQGIEVGLNPEDEHNCPVIVKAYRLRLRLQTQGQVEDILKKATESKSRQEIKAALRRAHNIDLPKENEFHAACLEIEKQLDESATVLAKAMSDRDYEALIVAINRENELGQQDEDIVRAANELLEKLKQANDNLRSALEASNFDLVMQELDKAKKAAIHCEAIDQAQIFVHNAVETSLKSAIENSTQPGADWSNLLKDALLQAQRLDMSATPLAVEAYQLQKKMKIIQLVRDGMIAKDIDGIKKALQRCTEEGLEAKSWEEIPKAQDYISQFEVIINKLNEAYNIKSPDLLEANIIKAEEANIPPRSIAKYKILFEKLSKMVILLTEATESGLKDKLDDALSQAQANELCWEHPAYLKARDTREHLLGFKEKLHSAYASKRLEELKTVLSAPDITDDHQVQDARAMLANMEKYDALLRIALAIEKDGKFESVAKAMNNMVDRGFSSLNMDQAKQWTNSYVRTALSTAKREAMVGGKLAEDWNKKLTLALNQANMLDMSDIQLAKDALKLKQHLTVLDGLQKALEEKSEINLDKFLKRATEMKMSDDISILSDALQYRANLDTSRDALTSAIKTRNPALITPAVEDLTKLYNPQEAKTNDMLIEGNNVLQQLNLMINELKLAKDSSEIEYLKKVLANANDLGLPKDVTEYIDAQRELEELSKFYQNLKVAMDARHFEDIKVSLDQANERGLVKKALPEILDAQALYTTLGKANAGLQGAVVSDDIDKMDEALKVAENVGLKGNSFNQARNRIKIKAKEKLKVEIERTAKMIQESEGETVDVNELAKAYKRFRHLKLLDLKLVMRAGALLSQNQDQKKAFEHLKAAVEKKDEVALDKALQEAKDANISEYIPAMADALDYKENLEEIREKLQRATKERNLDLLKESIEEANELGLDKTLSVWKEAQSLAPKLSEVAENLKNAMDTGNMVALEAGFTKATGLKMAQNTKILVESRSYQTRVITLEANAKIASRERRWLLIDNCIKEAVELKQTSNILILDLKGMHVRFKKINDDLENAMKNNDDEELDEAISNAHLQHFKSKILEQALLRVSEEIGLDLRNLLKQLDAKRKTKEIHKSLGKNLQRVEDLEIESMIESKATSAPLSMRKVMSTDTVSLRVSNAQNMHSTILVKARQWKKTLDKEEEMEKSLQMAYDVKDVEKLKIGVKKYRKMNPMNKDLLSLVQNYLDRLPPTTLHLEESKSSSAIESPLKYPTMSGQVSKRGRDWPYNWDDRWFVLGENLKYFENKQSEAPKAEVVMIEVHKRGTSHPVFRKKDYGFSIIGENRELFCCVKSERERKKWIEIISAHITVSRKIKRMRSIFLSICPEISQPLNVYQLSIVASVLYCPPLTERKEIISEIDENFSQGKISLKNCTDLVRKINPASQKQMNKTWRNAITKYLRSMSSSGKTTTEHSDNALLLAYALFIPPKAVLDRVRQYFRDLNIPLNFHNVLLELQKQEAASLALQLGLDCNVPLEQKEAQKKFRKHTRKKSFLGGIGSGKSPHSSPGKGSPRGSRSLKTKGGFLDISGVE